MSNSLWGRLDDVAGDAGHEHHQPRMGFFTDTSVCIGCKACEVACKEWNQLPQDGDYLLTGMSYDNTEALGSSTWRHVAFVEKPTAPPVDLGMPGDGPPGRDGTLPSGEDQATQSGDGAIRWLMSSDVCKHCTHAACLDVCPTESIQFGELTELRERAAVRVSELHAKGVDVARLYGADPDDGVGGDGAFFLLLDEPEVYGLPPDPVVTTRDITSIWRHVGAAAAALAALGIASFAGRRR
jgi:formate dehydrogenase iron-sulfur subunit